jgi:peptide/nickel transport system substrate-binding protein
MGTATEIYQLDPRADVSGGPLELVDVGAEVVISRSNPGYGDLTPETVEYHIYQTEEELVAALKNGEVHTLLTPKGITEQSAALLAKSPDVTILNTPTFGVRYLGFNLNRAPMSDLEFREAVAYLLDREEMAAEFAPTAIAASSMISASNPLWYDEEKSAEIAERRSGSLRDRLSKAIAGLKSTGYTWAKEPFVDKGRVVAGSGLLIDGVAPAPLTILTPGDKYDPARPLYAEEIASKIELLGFSVVPLATDFSTVVDLAFTPEEDGSRQYDMVLLGWSLGNPALPGFYGEIFGANAIANNTGYSRQKMEKLIERFRLATSIPQARKIAWEMEGLIADDLPYLPLYWANIIEAYRGDLVEIDIDGILGGIQASLGAFGQVTPKA